MTFIFNMIKILGDKNIFLLQLISQFIFADKPIVIDVRSLEEVKTGIIQDAIHIEWTEDRKEISNLDISKDQSIYLYCRSGNRSGKATAILEKMGFTNAKNVGGIIEAAEKLDKKIVKNSE